MDAQQFLAEFSHIANAPGGVARLRELVLQLAIQGKLVQQFLEDKIDFNHTTPLEGSNISGPYQIPANWYWSRFGEILDFQGGGQPPKSNFSQVQHEGYVQLIQIRDLGESPQPIFIPKDLASKFCTPKDILVGRYGASVGKVFWGKEGAYNVALVKMVDKFKLYDKEFLFILLKSPLGQNLFGGISRSAQDGFNKKDIEKKLIPAVPRKEQSRIVAKVDELMALCDQLEAQQQQRRVLQNQLRQSILQAVAASQSPHELKESWQRLDANFGQLFSAPEDVDDAIAEIKNLAARGLLAPAIQAKPDLEKIKEDCIAKRDEYITNGLMRRQKLVGMADNETVYPEHWDVCAFDEIAIVIGGVTKGRNLQGKKTVICPYLAVANVQRGYFKLENLKSIEIVTTELLKYVIESGDLLITEGGDWDKVGRTAIWREDASNILHQNHVFKARIPSTLIKNEWVELIFNSGIGRDYFAGASKQTTNLASINMTQLRSFPFPIPPLEEQENILTLFSTLENKCSTWRNKLERKQNLSALFASATIVTLTGIAIEQKEEPMKAPQTELVAPVRLGTPPDVKAQAPLATLLTRHNGEMSAKDLWQRFGGEIDAFYAQLKTEVANGWLLEPTPAEMHEKAER